MNTVTTTTFDVSDVKRATKPMSEDRRTGRAIHPSEALLVNDHEAFRRMLCPAKGSDWGMNGFSVGSFPSGLSKARFRWNYLD